jgi:hypothetical protein
MKLLLIAALAAQLVGYQPRPREWRFCVSFPQGPACSMWGDLHSRVNMLNDMLAKEKEQDIGQIVFESRPKP